MTAMFFQAGMEHSFGGMGSMRTPHSITRYGAGSGSFQVRDTDPLVKDSDSISSSAGSFGANGNNMFHLKGCYNSNAMCSALSPQSTNKIKSFGTDSMPSPLNFVKSAELGSLDTSPTSQLYSLRGGDSGGYRDVPLSNSSSVGQSTECQVGSQSYSLGNGYSSTECQVGCQSCSLGNGYSSTECQVGSQSCSLGHGYSSTECQVGSQSYSLGKGYSSTECQVGSQSCSLGHGLGEDLQAAPQMHSFGGGQSADYQASMASHAADTGSFQPRKAPAAPQNLSESRNSWDALGQSCISEATHGPSALVSGSQNSSTQHMAERLSLSASGLGCQSYKSGDIIPYRHCYFGRPETIIGPLSNPGDAIKPTSSEYLSGQPGSSEKDDVCRITESQIYSIKNSMSVSYETHKKGHAEQKERKGRSSDVVVGTAMNSHEAVNGTLSFTAESKRPDNSVNPVSAGFAVTTNVPAGEEETDTNKAAGTNGMIDQGCAKMNISPRYVHPSRKKHHVQRQEDCERVPSHSGSVYPSCSDDELVIKSSTKVDDSETDRKHPGTEDGAKLASPEQRAKLASPEQGEKPASPEQRAKLASPEQRAKLASPEQGEKPASREQRAKPASPEQGVGRNDAGAAPAMPVADDATSEPAWQSYNQTVPAKHTLNAKGIPMVCVSPGGSASSVQATIGDSCATSHVKGDTIHPLHSSDQVGVTTNVNTDQMGVTTIVNTDEMGVTTIVNTDEMGVTTLNTEQMVVTMSVKKYQTGVTQCMNKDHTGVTESMKRDQTGATASEKKDPTSVTATKEKHQTGATARGKKDKTGATATGEKDQTGATASGKKDQTGATVTRKKDQTGATVTRKKDQTGATATGGKDQTGATASGKKEQTGATVTRKKDQMGATARGKKVQTDATASGKKDHVVAERRVNAAPKYQRQNWDLPANEVLCIQDHPVTGKRYFAAYLCVAEADLERFGKKFHEEIEEWGFRILLPARDLLASGFHLDNICRALEERCQGKIIIVLSENFQASAECRFITHYARSLDPDLQKRNLIPVQFEKRRVTPPILNGVIVIDYHHNKRRQWLKQRMADAFAA